MRTFKRTPINLWHRNNWTDLTYLLALKSPNISIHCAFWGSSTLVTIPSSSIQSPIEISFTLHINNKTLLLSLSCSYCSHFRDGHFWKNNDKKQTLNPNHVHTIRKTEIAPHWVTFKLFQWMQQYKWCVAKQLKWTSTQKHTCPKKEGHVISQHYEIITTNNILIVQSWW